MQGFYLDIGDSSVRKCHLLCLVAHLHTWTRPMVMHIGGLVRKGNALVYGHGLIRLVRVHVLNPMSIGRFKLKELLRENETRLQPLVVLAQLQLHNRLQPCRTVRHRQAAL